MYSFFFYSFFSHPSAFIFFLPLSF
jgi:hypothetical protein